MTISLIMLIMYLESKFNYAKYWMMLWYLVPISIHSAVVYFVALRFIFFYLKKITVGKSLLVLLGFPIIIKLTPIFSEWTGISFFQSIIRKIDIYSDNTSYVNLFNTTLTMRLYIGVVLMFLFLIQYFVLLFHL